MMSQEEKVQSVWDTIWKEILEHSDGTPDMWAVKRELHDYAVLFKSVQTAYSRLTGGEVTNPFTPVDVLLSYADLYYQEMAQYSPEQEEEEFEEERKPLFEELYANTTKH